jgi:hypothetical protein
MQYSIRLAGRNWLRSYRERRAVLAELADYDQEIGICAGLFHPSERRANVICATKCCTK